MSFYEKDSLHSRGSIKIIEQCLEQSLLDDPEDVRCIYAGGLLSAAAWVLCTGRELIYMPARSRAAQRLYYTHISRLSLEHGDHGSPNVVLWQRSEPLTLNIPGKEAHLLASFLSGRITAATTPADPVTEVKRYKELYDLGAITAEEYERKKREILNL